MFVQCCSHVVPWQLSAFASHIMALLASCVSVVLQCIVIMSIFSVSGMPNKACQIPGTTKKLHIFFVIVFYFYFYMPNCVIVFLL